MLNASVGVQRVLGRLRRPPSQRGLERIGASRSRSLAVGRQVQARDPARVTSCASRPAAPSRTSLAASSTRPVGRSVRRTRSLVGRVGHDRVVALAVVGILVGATLVSLSVGRPRPPTTGNTNGAGTATADRRRRRRQADRRQTGQPGSDRRASVATARRVRIAGSDRCNPDDDSASAWRRRDRRCRAARDRPRPTHGRRRGAVHRGRHAGQADRRRHDRPRRQRPGQDLHRQRPARRSPRSPPKFDVSTMSVVVGEQPQVQDGHPRRARSCASRR